MSKTIELKPHERIIAVVPETLVGSGWRNEVVWVYILSPVTGFREVSLQPEERSESLDALFTIGDYVTQELQRAVPVKRVKD